MLEDSNSRTLLLVGRSGLKKLSRASIIVAGAGAVGGYALEGIVRAGVGRVRVVDPDILSESNLNRQILSTVYTIGKYKSDIACDRAKSINPSIDIEGMHTLITGETIPSVLSDDFDILIDAIDSVKHKVELLRGASERRIPTFSSMGSALHFDTQSIKVSNLNSTRVCPLASIIRSNLRDIDTSMITCVFSEEHPMTNLMTRDSNGKNILGSLPTIPAIFGMILANEAIRYIISKLKS